MSQSPDLVLSLALNRHWKQYLVLMKQCRKNLRRSSIHDLRIALRRLIASLEITEGIIASKEVSQLRGRLKNQLHLLRRLRDLQVQVSHLKEIKKGTQLCAFKKFLRRKLKSEKKKVRCNLWKSRIIKNQNNLIEITSHLKNDPKAMALLKEVLNRGFTNLKSCAMHIHVSDPATFHATRVRFKKYRYQREILEPVFPMGSSAKSKMKTLQTLLGDIQDTAVLIQSFFTFLIECGEDNPGFELVEFLLSNEEKLKNLTHEFQKEKETFLTEIQPNIREILKKSA